MTKDRNSSLDLALIGNGSYQALIDSHTGVQWLCLPRFDSSFALGSLLDDDKGGEFSVRPSDSDYQVKQRYLQNTAVLETTWSRDGGSFSVTDFAPRFDDADGLTRPRALVRRIRPLRGVPRLSLIARPVSDYGRSQQAPSAVHLQKSESSEWGTEIDLVDDIYVVLSWEQPLPEPLASTCESYLAKTIDYWQNWVSGLTLPSLYKAEVIRSAITLKLHQYDDTGAITAAATTSIPEHAGSGRNWDYRFCWPRDSYFTVDALSALGSTEECESYAGFLAQIATTKEKFQPLYGIGGETELREGVLEHLAGYRGDGPVRVGNEAYLQDQHDIYGEMIDAVAPVYRRAPRPVLRALLLRLADAIDANLHEPDAGLWEKRNEPARHSFSLLMHWVGARSLSDLGVDQGDKEMVSRGQELQERARRILDEECWNEEEGMYAETVGGSAADASLLFMINVGFLAEDRERASRHLDSLRERLQDEHGLFRRYLHDDGLGETHSTFTVCTLWYCEALARLGRSPEARIVLDAVLARANHVGLLSEDIDPVDGSLWGNFPQTYSHVGIIRCALALHPLQTPASTTPE
jgi:GH15 family glucan-1,4-alpha-glucosidase